MRQTSKNKVKKLNFNLLKNLLTEKKSNVRLSKSLKGDTGKQKKMWSLKIEQKSRHSKINQQCFI